MIEKPASALPNQVFSFCGLGLIISSDISEEERYPPVLSKFQNWNWDFASIPPSFENFHRIVCVFLITLPLKNIIKTIKLANNFSLTVGAVLFGKRRKNTWKFMSKISADLSWCFEILLISHLDFFSLVYFVNYDPYYRSARVPVFNNFEVFLSRTL